MPNKIILHDDFMLQRDTYFNFIFYIDFIFKFSYV